MDPEANPSTPEEQPSDQLPPLEPSRRGTFLSQVPTPRLIAVIVAVLAILGAAIGIGVAYNGRTSSDTSFEPTPSATKSATAITSPTPTSTPQLVARLLDGTMVSQGEENVRPLGVMIENHPDARPQSGLAQANWVYEAIAEGGITRFLALFANPDTTQVRVGPIRSVRTYYLDYAREYNAYLSHVGGNMDALDSIQANGGVTNLDQFSIGSPVYQRDNSRKVATEHTMYSTTDKLWNYITGKNLNSPATFQSLPFMDDAAKSARPETQTASINFSTASFAVSWTYDPSTNTYARTMAGAPHKDAVTGEQITTKNIVIQTVQRKATVTRINEQGWIYTLTGSGPVTILENGTAIKGTWKRQGNERTRYYTADGTEISLVRGTTWVEVVHPDIKVAVTPPAT